MPVPADESRGARCGHGLFADAAGSPGRRELSSREAEIINSYEIEGLPSISEVRRFHKIPSLSNGRKARVKTLSIGGIAPEAWHYTDETRTGKQKVLHQGLVLKRGKIFSTFQVSSELCATGSFMRALQQQVDRSSHARCAGSTLHAPPKLAYIFKVDVSKIASRSCNLWTWTRDIFRRRAASKVQGRRGTLLVFCPGSGSSDHALCSPR